MPNTGIYGEKGESLRGVGERLVEDEQDLCPSSEGYDKRVFSLQISIVNGVEKGERAQSIRASIAYSKGGYKG